MCKTAAHGNSVYSEEERNEMLDTPRTDEALLDNASIHPGGGGTSNVVSADFARKLERELAAAIRNPGSLDSTGSATETIRSISRGPDGKSFAVYLRDNIRISIGRTTDTQGPAWLEITETPIVRSSNSVNERR